MPSPPRPLDEHEERFWRALTRLVVALPRTLDDDMTHMTGLSLHEYVALMHLSEADDRRMRMADLANAMALSPSRITRLVDDLRTRGLVDKQRSADDGRGNVASLTPEGLARLEAAYPDHLKSVRHRVVDHLDATLTPRMAAVITDVADGLS